MTSVSGMSDAVSRFPVTELEDLPELRAFLDYHEVPMERSDGLSKAERELVVVATSGANRLPRRHTHGQTCEPLEGRSARRSAAGQPRGSGTWRGRDHVITTSPQNAPSPDRLSTPDRAVDNQAGHSLEPRFRRQPPINWTRARPPEEGGGCLRS
ncbi:MAG: hypothetical protein QOI78_7897 [Actinomycetota bacterium]|nr:hypothetical protein [Actinomycetota bacterium]